MLANQSLQQIYVGMYVLTYTLITPQGSSELYTYHKMLDPIVK